MLDSSCHYPDGCNKPTIGHRSCKNQVHHQHFPRHSRYHHFFLVAAWVPHYRNLPLWWTHAVVTTSFCTYLPGTRSVSAVATTYYHWHHDYYHHFFEKHK